MAGVLEQLGGELSRTPSDHALLRAFADRCLEVGELARLRSGLEPVLGTLAGPLAVRPVADAIARALTEAAARAERRAPREAVELHLRAARLLAQLANDRIGAARSLASAWRLVPDERVAALTQTLFQGTGEPPDYTLWALSEVGSAAQRLGALRRLAADALERRRLDQAEHLFARLDALSPGDPDVAAGREVIAGLRRGVDDKLAALEVALGQATNASERGAIERRRGEVLRGAGRLAEARAAYLRSVEAGDESALRPLEAVSRELGAIEHLCEDLTRLVERGAEASIALRRKLFLLLEELGRAEEAQRLLTTPRGGTAHTRLEELYADAQRRAASSPLESALRLEEWAAACPDADAKVQALAQAAQLASRARQGEGPSEVEERLWRKVKALDPRARGAADFYRELYRRQPDPRRALANLAQLHALSADPEERRALATEMATLAETSLGQLDKAIEAWRLVERDSEGPAFEVWAELRRLYAAAGRWHAYVDLLDRWGQATSDVAEKIELLFDAVEVYQDPARLPMPAMVLQTYQRIVALAPSHPIALDRLAVGLAEREQWTDLLRVLAQKVDHTSDPQELIGLFHQIADLYLDHIHSESQSVIVLERLLEIDPDDIAVVRRLRELYRRRHDAERHFLALERELELTEEPAERVAILELLAETAQREFLQPDRAADYHRQILEIEPGREQSLEALQALHAEQEDWPAYARVLEQRVHEAKTKAAKLPLLLELGECVLTRLGDVERAEQIFQTIAESSPTSAPARRFLQRIFVARQKWDELARLFTRPTRTTAGASAGGARWKDYLALLKDAAKQETEPHLVAAIQVELARVCEVELEDRKAAAEHLELALRATDDRHDLAEKALALLGEEAPGARRLTALGVIARHAPTAEERYRAWWQVAQIHRRAKDPVAACEAWGKALVVGAELGLIDALPQLEEDAGATGRWEQAYNHIDEALGRLPPDERGHARVALHRSLGTIARTRLAHPADAVAHFRWVLQLAPGDTFALEELEKVYLAQSDFAGLEEVYRARLEAGATPAQRLAALKELARLFDDVMLDGERAAQVQQEILQIAPGDREAQASLLRSLEASGSWSELAALIEAALTRVGTPGERQTLQAKLAELCADRLGEIAAAIDHCRDVVERADAADDAALAKVVPILERYLATPMFERDVTPILEVAYRKERRLDDLVEVLERRARHALPAELPAILDESLMLIGGVAAAPEKAFKILLRRFQVAPGDEDVWQELERAAALTGGWEELAAVFGAALTGEPEVPMAVRPTLRLRLADVYHRHLIELEEAIVQTERALAETHDDGEKLAALEGLEVLFKKTADLESFVRVKLEASRRVLSRTLRRQKVFDAAQALAGALGRPEDAIAVLEPLWIDDPGDVDVADQILALSERVGDAARTDALFGDAIDASRSDARRDALRYRRALMRRDKLGLWEVAISELIGLVDSVSVGKDARQALLEVSRAQESEAQRDVILEVLVDHHRRVGDTEGLINALVVQAEFTQAGPERATVLRAAAVECLPYLEEAPHRVEEAQHAFDLYGQALFENPADADTLAAMRRIAGLCGLWSELGDVLSAVVDAHLAIDDRAGAGAVRQLLREEARIAEEELADDTRAVASLTRELGLADEAGQSDVGEALASLSRLYERAGDFDARRDVLQRVVSIEPDAARRAEVLETMAEMELELGRAEEAVVALEGALDEVAQGPVGAAGVAARATRQRLLATLESVLRGAGRFGELVEVLAQAATREDEPGERRELMHRAAECAIDDLDDADRAVALYEELALADASDEVAIARLVELHLAARRWPDAIAALGRQKALAEGAGAIGEVREIAFRIGKIEAEEAGQGEAALRTFGDVLAGDPAHAGALAALARLETKNPSLGTRARALLADAYRQGGDAAQLAAVLERMATFDAPAPSLLAELAELWMGELGNPARAWPHAVRGYALAPTSEAGLGCRAHLFELVRREPVATRVTAERRLVSTLVEASRSLTSPSVRRERKADDLSKAVALGVRTAELVPLWRAILAEEPKDPEVLTALEAWARGEGDLALLAEALEHRAAGLPPGERAPVELELAETLAGIAGREVEALKVWRGLLARDPDNDAAFEGLDITLAALGRHAERATLIEARLVRSSGPTADALRIELAHTHWQHLQDAARSVDILAELEGPAFGERAIGLLESIWGEGAERPRVYRILEPLYLGAGDWDKLVALYTSTLEQDDPELQVECLSKLAELERVRLHKPEAAFSTLLALVERSGDATSGATHLAELEDLARRLGRWDELVDRLEAMVAMGHGGSLLMARLARIHESERDDPERAAHFYRFAFEHDPSDTASRDALSALFTRHERWGELVRHLLEAARKVDGPDRSKLRLDALEVLDQRLGEPREALAVAEQVLADPDADEASLERARAAIASLLEHLHDRAALHRHLRRWLEQAPSDEVAVDVQVRLGRSLILSAETAREGLTELEEVLRRAPSRRDVVPALWSMIVACERAELAAQRGEAPEDAEALDEPYREATAEAARILEGVVGVNAPPVTLVGIVQAQLRVMPAGAERQATLVRLASLVTELDQPEQAFAYLAEALRGDLENGEIESRLEAIAGTHDYWEALAALYEECAAQEDERVASRYVLKVAGILRERLGHLDEAAIWYERYLAYVPGSREAVDPLARYYADIGDANAEARIIEQWIDVSAAPAELTNLRMRLGVLRMDQLGDVQGAIDALEACLPEGASDGELVRRLERLYVRGEHFSALVELYRAALGHADSDKGRLETLAKMAQVYETRLTDPTSARETCRRMLALEPLNRFALTTLERIERAAGDWDAVDEVLGKKLQITEAAAPRVRMLIDRADVAGAHRQRPDEAIEHLLAADALWESGPGPDELIKGLEALLRSEPAIRRRAARALEKRYRARSAWQQLINALLIELVASPEANERFTLATQAAQIAVERLGDRALALRVLLAALRQAPEAAELRTLVEQAAQAAGDFASLLRTGDDMLKRGVPEPALAGFALWLGRIEHAHGERARAVRAFERVLEVEPGNAQAGDALATLYREHGDYAALRGIYNERLAVASESDKPLLELDLALHMAGQEGLERTIAAIGELLAHHSTDDRLGARLRACVEEPLAGAAAAAVLSSQLRRERRWSDLVALLEARGEKAPDAGEQAHLWEEAAAIHASELGDEVAAVRAFGRAALAKADDREMWSALRAKALEVGAEEVLVNALAGGVELASPAVAAELARWLAELHARRLGAPEGRDRALEVLRRAAARAPDDVPVHEAIVRLELERGDLAAIEEDIASLTDLIEDDDLARSWWRVLRDLAEQRGDEARLVAANEALLARDHRDVEAAEHLASFYRRSARWDELIELLFLCAQGAQQDEEADAAARYWVEIGQVREGPLADADGALDAWQEAWTLDTANIEATRKLVASAVARGEWDEVAMLWQGHAAALTDPDRRARTLVELGRVREDKLKDVAAAAAAYEEALAVAPATLPALNALIGLHGRSRRYTELADLLERKAAVVSGAERTMALLQAAAVHLDQLRSSARARPLVDEIMAADPDHLEGRLLLSRLHLREGRPLEAAATLRDLSQRTEGKRKLRLLMDLARVLIGEAGDNEGAAEVIEEAIAIDPAAPGLEALATEVFTRAEAWPRLRRYLEGLYQASAKGAERAERALALARLHAGPLPDPERLNLWVEAARAADPERSERLDVRLLEVDRVLLEGDDEQAEGLLSRIVTQLEDQRAVDELATRSHQLGLVRERLGHLEEALAAFARAHELDGKNAKNLLAYGRTLVAAARWGDALAVHQALLLQRQALPREEDRLAVLERLAIVCAELGQIDRARTYLNKLLAERPDHPHAAALRTRLRA